MVSSNLKVEANQRNHLIIKINGSDIRGRDSSGKPTAVRWVACGKGEDLQRIARAESTAQRFQEAITAAKSVP